MASLLATGLPWAADNGAFSGFDAELFGRYLRKIEGQPNCLWVVAPDVVMDARATLVLFHQWLPQMQACAQPIAFVGQDGAEELEMPWDAFRCWFIGGSTAWKLSQSSAGLASEAKRRGKVVHMGRVNSLKRMRAAYDMGCDSVDGSSASMFGDKYIHDFCAWIEGLHQQRTFFREGS